MRSDVTGGEKRRGGLLGYQPSNWGPTGTRATGGGEGAGGVAAERERERAVRMRAGERERSSTVRTIARKHW